MLLHLFLNYPANRGMTLVGMSDACLTDSPRTPQATASGLCSGFAPDYGADRSAVTTSQTMPAARRRIPSLGRIGAPRQTGD